VAAAAAEEVVAAAGAAAAAAADGAAAVLVVLDVAAVLAQVQAQACPIGNGRGLIAPFVSQTQIGISPIRTRSTYIRRLSPQRLGLSMW